MEVSKWKTDCRQFDEIVMNDLRIKLTTPIGNNSSLDFIDLNQNQIKENTNTKSLFVCSSSLPLAPQDVTPQLQMSLCRGPCTPEQQRPSRPVHAAHQKLMLKIKLPSSFISQNTNEDAAE